MPSHHAELPVLAGSNVGSLALSKAVSEKLLASRKLDLTDGLSLPYLKTTDADKRASPSSDGRSCWLFSLMGVNGFHGDWIPW